MEKISSLEIAEKERKEEEYLRSSRVDTSVNVPLSYEGQPGDVLAEIP